MLRPTVDPGRVGRWLLAVVLLAPALAWASLDCPPLPGQVPAPPPPRVPTAVPWDGLAAPRSAVDWHGGYDDAPFGVGHLPVENADKHFYDWPRALVLPLWSRPEGPFLAWLQAARVHPVDGSPSSPLTGAGLVETGYEHLTFIVMATRGDGWLQLRLAPGDNGTAWTHACHLGLGPVKLNYQPWKSFLAEHGDWLHFRARVAHALRAAPDTGSRRVTWIGLDHELEMLEMRGDWMRVRVRQPAWTCTGSDQPFPGRVDEGWVQWRDEVTGPWTWIYSRGC
jgi:hypothetical protein